MAQYMHNNHTPLVSIVIFVRNEVKFIGKTIESALSQDYPEIEIHVQDGGSTDGTVDVLKSYPIKWVSEKDSGQGNAGNRGINATKGEIVIMLPGDDLLLPGSVRTLVDTLVKNPDIGFAYGDVEVVDANDKPYSMMVGQSFDLDKMFWRHIVPTQSVASRRSALVDVGLYREDILCIDWDLFLRLGAKFKSIYIPKTLARYRSHDGSSSLNYAAFMSKSIYTVADTLLSNPVVTSQLRLGIPRAFAGAYITAALVSVLANQVSTGWGLYWRAIRKYPKALLTVRGVWAAAGLLMGTNLYSRVRNRGRGSG